MDDHTLLTETQSRRWAAPPVRCAPETDLAAPTERPPTAACGVRDEARAISRLIERLVARFPELPACRVEAAVVSAHQTFEGARVRGYVPLLVEHDVLIQLKTLASAADPVPGSRGRLPGVRDPLS